jgi:TolB-like protein
MERRLAAILATDVVGYSRLMELDEAGTLTELKAHRRDLIEPAISQHHGRTVKLMGDGALVEFASVVDAVMCSVAIQTGMMKRNDAVAKDRRIDLRAGIHLGDIIVEGEDIYGDGVNIAARLEALAVPGGICISQQAYDQVETKLNLQFEDLGPHKIKNIARPIHLWGWAPEGDGKKFAAAGPKQGKSSLIYDRPTIAVLPFTNMYSDPGQEYFSDGITEDIITALSRCRWLHVVARNSAFAFKGKSVDVRETAKELNAGYVLEGSIRRSGDRVRITAQLVNGRDGTHLWGERYDRNIEDIFALQDEITGVIIGTIEPELSKIEGEALLGRPTTDLNAWESYQRGLWHLYRFKADELETAKDLFERAISLDPAFAQAYARLGYVHIQLGWYGPWENRVKRLSDAITLARRGVELDDREPATRLSLGRALALSGEIESGLDELRMAVELDPSFAQAHFALGQALSFLERLDEALHEINEALRLSPRDPHLWTFLNARAIVHYIAGDLEEAEADERSALRQPATTFHPALFLAAIYGRQGKMHEASEAITNLNRFRPGYTCTDARREWYFGDRPFRTQRFIDQFVADLRKAGLPE